MIKITESAGNIRLCKFVAVASPMFAAKVKNYDEKFGGYIIVHTYDYNFLLNDVTDDYLFHSDLSKELPAEAWLEWKKDGIIGSVEYEPEVDTKFLTIEGTDSINHNQLEYLERYIHAYAPYEKTQVYS